MKNKLFGRSTECPLYRVPGEDIHNTKPTPAGISSDIFMGTTKWTPVSTDPTFNFN
jgi:hypothetical protein